VKVKKKGLGKYHIQYKNPPHTIQTMHKKNLRRVLLYVASLLCLRDICIIFPLLIIMRRRFYFYSSTGHCHAYPGIVNKCPSKSKKITGGSRQPYATKE